jgi:cyclopropane fatty-acyl-phospholipid synthase-like methyltransferase
MARSPAQLEIKKLLKLRFKAWWDGVELADLLEAIPEQEKADGEKVKAKPKIEAPPAPPLLPFESPEIRIKQQIWGEGFYKPGGPDYIQELVKPFALNPSLSVMDFGAGLGGSTRTIATSFDVWVVGYEPDTKLAEAGKQLSLKAGLEKKADVIHYDAKAFEPRQGSVDCIVSTETFFLIKDKFELLKILERTLKTRGQITITDFVRPDPVAKDDPVGKEFSSNPQTPIAFWSDEEYQRRFRELNFDLRVSEDITAKYRAMILAGWVAFTQAGGDAAANARTFPEALVSEVELWVRRVAALDAGKLRLMRYYAIKLGAAKMMSDW